MAYSKKKIKSSLGKFLQQYNRKSATHDPNDRSYDRKLEEKIKRMKPEELYNLLKEDD